MQGFRRAFVITGFIILGLGSHQAWQYPRPEALGLKLDSPQALMASSESVQAAGVRCRPNSDWTDLLVESSENEKAREALQGYHQSPGPSSVGRPQIWQTPPALLADLAHLPGVQQANVVVHNSHEAVVMLSMQHGAFAGDRDLMSQVVQVVQSHQPALRAENVKILDSRGADLNYAAPNFASGSAHPLQTSIQSQLDGLLGPRQSLFFCRLRRGQAQKIHLQSVLYLQACPEEQAKAAQELTEKATLKWVEEQNARLKTDQAAQVQTEIYPYLGENSYRKIQRSWRQDRENGLTLEKGEVKEWTLVQRTMPLDELKALQWGLTSPPPTPGQLFLGLSALAPALFGWCLLVPWLVRRHRLSSAASATL